MEYKIGELVRLLNDRLHFKKDDIFIIKEVRSEHVMLCDDWGITFDKVEPVTHLTTKEFVKLVEDMGYKTIESYEYLDVKTKDNAPVCEINKLKVNSAVLVMGGVPRIVIDIIIHMHTPLELREEKEQLYTLELPNNEPYGNRFYNKKENYYFFGGKRNLIGCQTQFTQSEINELKKGSLGELIKSLKQEPVQEEE